MLTEWAPKIMAKLKTLPAVNREGTRRIEVVTSEPARALAWLGGQTFTLSATIFGQAVHSVVDDRVADDELARRMRDASFGGIEIRGITPSLGVIVNAIVIATVVK